MTRPDRLPGEARLENLANKPVTERLTGPALQPDRPLPVPVRPPAPAMLPDPRNAGLPGHPILAADF
eukprot:3143731-Heterocapsa_arctica.AAC.1